MMFFIPLTFVLSDFINYCKSQGTKFTFPDPIIAPEIVRTLAKVGDKAGSH